MISLYQKDKGSLKIAGATKIKNSMKKINNISNAVRKLNPKNWKNLYKEYHEIILYLIFGILTTFVSFAAYFLFRLVFDSTTLPVTYSWVCAVAFAYVTNRVWVFESEARAFFMIVREIIYFFAVRLLTLFVDMGIMYALVDLPGSVNTWHEVMVKCISTIVVIILNYIFSKIFVFKR
jgi:putative flippase GtrA